MLTDRSINKCHERTFGCVKIDPSLDIIHMFTRKHRSSGLCMSILLWEGGGKLFFAPLLLRDGEGEGGLNKGGGGGLSK